MGSTEVVEHYGSAGLGHQLLAALEEAFGDSLDASALRGVDQFHLGGHRSTEAMLDGLDLSPDAVVLDVGCGIGGVARDLRARFGCSVAAIDITPEFIEAAQLLSDRVGASSGIDFAVGDALDLPHRANHFDAAVVVHVGMNIPDKTALVAELCRVTKSEAPIVIYDIVRRTDAPLTYPLPWASDESTDFVAGQDTYAAAMAASELGIESAVDRTPLVFEAIEQATAHPAPVNLAHLMGSEWPTMFGNLVAALREGTVAPVQMTTRSG